MTRRGLLAVATAAGCGVARAQGIDGRTDGGIDVGPPLVVVTLRISPADDTGFLHDLADYTNQHGFVVLGRPGGPQLGDRAVFLAWFRRDDGVTLLVTDITAPERMQAFFYPRKDGTAAPETSDLAQDYARKMASYPAFGGRP